jgi:Protein of unknown function (DUF4236)
MGFYIRKGFNFGPLRLNLSRSGLGTSLGVKGFRIGLGPRGAYLHAGRGGLYYRQSLGGRSPATPGPERVPDPLQPIDSGDVGQMIGANAAQVLSELNRVQHRMDLALLTGLLAVAAVVGEWFLPVIPVWGLGLTAILGVALVVYARHNDVTRGTAVLHYDLDDGAVSGFNALKSAFGQFAACQGLWHVEAAGQTDDWKRNAGATSLVRRTAIRPVLGLPRRVQSNVEVPFLLAGRQRLYFFPDHLFIYDGSLVGALAYPELRVEVSSVAFREDGQVPTDAKTVGSTWRYVNKNGGPDRRFAGNREIPIVEYATLALETDSGLREHFQCSQVEAAQQFSQALESWRRGSHLADTPGGNQSSDGRALPESTS